MSFSTNATEQLQGIDIAKVLREKGPIVTCVVLRAASNDQDGKKPSSTNNNDSLVEEIQLDTTPKKNEVEKILGGPFTFVGQYEEEGIMLMAKKECVFNEGEEQDEEEDPIELPLNPHKLQPPFDKTKIYGDILLLKVAECEDPLDDPKKAEGEKPTVSVATNDEFFLNYTKEEYLKFAARTDVVPPALPSDAEEEEEECGEEEEEEEEEEGDWSGEEDEEDDIPDEEAQGAIMQLLMTNVLRKFNEENGRGPSTEELLALKAAIAQKLGLATENKEHDAGDDEKEGSNKDETNVTAVESPEHASKETTEQGKKRSSDDTKAEDTEEPTQKKTKSGVEESEEKAKVVLAP